MPVNILLSFTGFHDPYTKTAVAGEEQRGPILTALTAHEFDRVILFGAPRTLALTDATAEVLKNIAPEVTVEVIALPLQDPTDYTQIIVNLRTRCGEIIERFPTARLYVSTASGTPGIRACRLLLAASGELPARFSTPDHHNLLATRSRWCPRLMYLELPFPGSFQ